MLVLDESRLRSREALKFVICDHARQLAADVDEVGSFLGEAAELVVTGRALDARVTRVRLAEHGPPDLLTLRSLYFDL